MTSRVTRVPRRNERATVDLFEDPIRDALAMQARADRGEVITMAEATRVLAAVSALYEDPARRPAIQQALGFHPDEEVIA